MRFIADILMIAGTFSIAIYCIVLARRLSKFTDLERGVGGAIAVLSAQVDDMTKMLTRAQKTAAGSAIKLEEVTTRAEEASNRLELLIASLHDLPEQPEKPLTQEKAVSGPPAENQFFSQRAQMEAAE